MAPVKKVVRWKSQRAFKMAPRRHAFPQKREAQPIWRHFGFASPLADIQGWKSNGSRMAHGNVVLQNKSLSRWRYVVVDYLKKSKIYLPNWSCGPLHKIVVVRNMRFVSPKVWNMWWTWTPWKKNSRDFRFETWTSIFGPFFWLGTKYYFDSFFVPASPVQFL